MTQCLKLCCEINLKIPRCSIVYEYNYVRGVWYSRLEAGSHAWTVVKATNDYCGGRQHSRIPLASQYLDVYDHLLSNIQDAQEIQNDW